jgi:hypothetical protein
MKREELIVSFMPRLDLLAWTFKLTLQGARQELPVALEIEANGGEN